MKVCSTVGEINVYANDQGTVSITQESLDGGDADCVHIPTEHIAAFCRALRTTAKGIVEG